MLCLVILGELVNSLSLNFLIRKTGTLNIYLIKLLYGFNENMNKILGTSQSLLSVLGKGSATVDSHAVETSVHEIKMEKKGKNSIVYPFTSHLFNH